MYRGLNGICSISLKREEADIGDADLEEGEIADDDEDAQPGVPKPSEETAGEKGTNLESETKKEEPKIGTDISSLKSGVSGEKRRDKRGPSNSNQSRLRKRTLEDDPPNHREMHVSLFYLLSLRSFVVTSYFITVASSVRENVRMTEIMWTT